MKYNVLITFIFLLSNTISAQDNIITIKVVDKLTAKSIEGVTLQMNDSVKLRSNYSGYLQIKASEGDTVRLFGEEHDETLIIIPATPKFTIALERKLEKLEFSSGIVSFYDSWAKNLKYPSGARNGMLQRDIYVLFTVDSLGNSILINVLNDKGKVFQPEINRVFKLVNGKWSTEYYNKVFLLPIKFRIASESPPKISFTEEIYVDRILKEIVVTTHRKVMMR